jgi:uracil-DNA glycosylase
MTTEDANSPSTALDARQRSMLEAMGITLWEPQIDAKKEQFSDVDIGKLAIKNVANATPEIAITAPSATPAAAPRAAPPAISKAPAVSTLVVSAPGARAVALQPLPDGIAQMDWLQLQSTVSSCQACALCEGRKNTVFGMGQAAAEPTLAPRADWLIVGEAPDENEDSQGEPFAGQAGKLLDNMLRAVLSDGKPLSRQSNVFIANVLKCRPPANRNPSADEIAMCQPYLQRQIALLQPKIIIAMGRFAVQSLLGSTEPLGKLRGRVHSLPGCAVPMPVIVTYHPAYLLRNLPDKAKAWADLMLAMETVQASAP